MSQYTALDNQRVIYKKIVIEHFRRNNGYFIVLTKDDAFTILLKQVIKDLGLAIENLFTVVNDDFELLRAIKEFSQANKRIVLFIEVDEQGIIEYFLKQIKGAYPTINIIALVGLKQKGQVREVSYFDNFIVRPISADSLLEKLVFTIKPQANFGKLIDAGRTLLAQRKFENAEQIAQAIIEKKPGSMAGHLLLGDVYREQQLYRNAEIQYWKAHNFVPTALEPLISLVDIARRQDDQNKLDEYIRKTIAISSDKEKDFLEQSGYSVDLDTLYSKDERHKKLREYFKDLAETVTKMLPLLQEEKASYGIMFINSFLSAKENFIEKEDGLLYEKVASFYRAERKPREAIKAYHRCITLLPKRAETHYQLAMTYYEEGLIEQAHSAVRRLLQLNPRYGYNSYTIAYNLGVIFQSADDMESAKIWLNLATELEKREKQLKAKNK